MLEVRSVKHNKIMAAMVVGVHSAIVGSLFHPPFASVVSLGKTLDPLCLLVVVRGHGGAGA